MTLIIVSEVDEVKHSWRFARMPQTEVGMENPANYRADADATPTLRNHCGKTASSPMRIAEPICAICLVDERDGVPG
jgi:hypothetical protein